MRAEEASFEEQLSRRWRPALMAFFLRRVRDRSEAEDLTQEVFLRVLNGARAGEQPDAYVFQIAQNLLVDRSRRALVRSRYREEFGSATDRHLDPIDPHRLAEGREQLSALVAALAELPERSRTIFILYRVEGMSQDAIGAIYGISASAVKQQVARAMARIVGRMRELT